MEHIAIDLGGRESQICVRDEKGTVLEERRVKTQGLVAYLSKRPPGRVLVETCAESFALAEGAQGAGHQVRIVPSGLVKALGVGARGVKTDRRDAQILSEVSCRIELPSVHLPSEQSRQQKTECGMREALVGARTQMVNTVRGWLRTQMVQVRPGGVESFVRRVRDQSDKGLELPSYVERTLVTIEQLSEQIKAADKELVAQTRQDPVCQRLMSVPGVGPVTAMRFRCALDEAGRFSNAAQVGSYLGLVPSENSSSERKRLGRITKAGSRQTRWALVQAAWSFYRWAEEKDPVRQWVAELEHRRGRKVAIVALARKLSGILFALWRDETTYLSPPKEVTKRSPSRTLPPG